MSLPVCVSTRSRLTIEIKTRGDFAVLLFGSLLVPVQFARVSYSMYPGETLPGVFEPRSPAATSCSLVRSIADTPAWQAPRARGSSFGRFDANDRVDWMSRKRGRGWRAHSRAFLEETLEHTPAPGSCRLIVKRPCHIVCL